MGWFWDEWRERADERWERCVSDWMDDPNWREKEDYDAEDDYYGDDPIDE